MFINDQHVEVCAVDVCSLHLFLKMLVCKIPEEMEIGERERERERGGGGGERERVKQKKREGERMHQGVQPTNYGLFFSMSLCCHGPVLLSPVLYSCNPISSVCGQTH